MADPKRAYTENVAGDFFVDDTCIDCDLCRQIAPSVFKEALRAFRGSPSTTIAAKRAQGRRWRLSRAPPARSERAKNTICARPWTRSRNLWTKMSISAVSLSHIRMVAASYLILRPEGNRTDRFTAVCKTVWCTSGRTGRRLDHVSHPPRRCRRS